VNDDNDTNESTQPNPAALERVSATEKFPEQLPGVLFVTCPGGCSSGSRHADRFMSRATSIARLKTPTSSATGAPLASRFGSVPNSPLTHH
jgi:hypothetical protein